MNGTQECYSISHLWIKDTEWNKDQPVTKDWCLKSAVTLKEKGILLLAGKNYYLVYINYSGGNAFPNMMPKDKKNEKELVIKGLKAIA